MNAKKHTPGPWLRDDCSGLDCDVRAASGRKVALCWGLASNNATNYRADYRAECDANARLIAAAPELLEALQSIAEYWNRDQNETAMADACWHAIETAMAAITKATGDQQ